jgi:hypothetical protein
MTARGRDNPDGVIDLSDGDIKDVVIRIARGARVAGKVTDRNGRLVPAFVIAVPEDERLANVRRYVRMTAVDENGQFELSQLGSGPFWVVALDGPIPEDLNSLRGKGTMLSITPGTTVSVQLIVGK